MHMRIGIQGDIGSTNERAAKVFADRYGWNNAEIRYLISTENVLRALEAGEIEYGTFATETSRAGAVEETRLALLRYSYHKVDEVILTLDHALLSRCDDHPNEDVLMRIFSHPQALKEHRPYIESVFPGVELIETVDTALAAKHLAEGTLPPNSLVIAPRGCAEIYGLLVYRSDLPTNAGYEVTIVLAQNAKK
jgi:prephenate dehydratase